MAKEEMMDLGSIVVQSELEVLTIKKLSITERANEHGRLELLFLSKMELTPKDSLRYQQSSICLQTKEGDRIFCGFVSAIGLKKANAYTEIEVIAYTHSLLTDEEKKKATFQSETKTLQQVLNEGMGKNGLVVVDEDIPLKEMLSQQEETDWAFGRRIANQYGKQLFVNGKATGCHIHVGARPFQVKELGTAERICQNRDVDKVRLIKGNDLPSASVFEFEETLLKVYDLTLGAGYAVSYQGRQQTVVKSEIYSFQGAVLNRITLANEEGLVSDRGSVTGRLERPGDGAGQVSLRGRLSGTEDPAAERFLEEPGHSLRETGRNSILTGTVLAIEGTSVQVDFGSPGDVPRWMPYASGSGNYFYAMPDIGDTVFVYYETGDSEKIVCLGSKHVNQSPDFANYKDKMVTANNRMIKFSAKEVNLIGNRQEYDGMGGNQAKIVFHDKTGLEINSTQDIVLETTDGGRITLQAMKDSFGGMETMRNTFVGMHTSGAAKYMACGGKPQADVLGHLAKTEWNKLKQNVIDNLTSPFQVISTLQELGDRIGGSAEGEEEVIESPAEFIDGVAMVMGLKRMVIQVGNSCAIFGGGIIRIRSNTYMQLGTKRSIGYTHLEDANYTWKDMFLDITQCALDIIGVLPIPGAATAANLINAGISFARGDYVGAAMSAGQAALSLIPGANTAVAPMAAVKIAGKAAKTGKAVGQTVKVAKLFASGAENLNMVLTAGMAGYDVVSTMLSGEFDLNSPDCRQDVANLIQGMGKGAKGKIEVGKNRGNDGKDRRKTRGERAQERTGRKEAGKETAPKVKETMAQLKQRAQAKLDEYAANRCKNGDPIDIVTGSYLIEQCDFIINDITGRFALERTYESLLCEKDSPIGRGWTLNLFSEAVVYDDRVEVVLPDNHTETFLKTGEGYRSRRGGSKRLALCEREKGFRLREAFSGRYYDYDEGGKLLSITDQNGNQTLYRYQGDTLKRICFASGQYLSLTWQGEKLLSMEDCIGRKVAYHYEGELLTRVEMVNGGVETYAYDGKGRVVEITNANGVTYVHNEYDHKHRVIRQKLQTGQEYVLFYEDDNRTNTCLEVEKGKKLRYVYNRKRQLIRTEYEDGTTVELGYDEWENKVWEKNRLGHERSRRYDEFGHLLEEKEADGLIRSFQYDERGNCIKKWDNVGLCSRYTYDKQGNLLREVQQIDGTHKREVSYEYDAYGRIMAFTDGKGNRESYCYDTGFFTATCFTTAEGNRYHHELDKAGRPVAIRDMDGTSTYAYNHFDLLCRETDPLGHTTKYRYDSVLDLVGIVNPNGVSQGGMEAAQTYTYDAFHHLLCRTDETGAVFATKRDGEGNLLKEIHPNTYDKKTKEGEGITYVYDKEDRPLLIQFPEGGRESRRYDAEGNLIQVSYWYDAPGNQIKESCQYDAEENLTKESRSKGQDSKEETKAEYHYTYDVRNRLTGITGPDGAVKKKFIYDLHGNLCKEIDAKGMATGERDEERIGTLYTYNYVGWLMEKRTPVRIEEGQAFYRLERYAYDLAGNRIQEKRYLEEQSTDGAGGRVLTIDYTYDRDNRLVEVKDSTGAAISYRYDEKNRKVFEGSKINEETRQIFQYTYDAGGRLIKMTKGADKEGCGKSRVSVYYEYDKNGNNTRILLPSKARIQREYDAAGHLIKELHMDKRGGIHNETRFFYDPAGNLICLRDNQGREVRIGYDLMNREISRTEKDGGVIRLFYERTPQPVKVIGPNEYALYGEEGEGIHYTYDKEGRVLRVTGPDGSLLESNLYDEAGLLLSTTDGEGSAVTYSYDLGGRRTRIVTTAKAGQGYTYDVFGHITSVVDGEGNKTCYGLDSWGRIVDIKKADGSHEYYGYDCGGNLISATDGEGHTTTWRYNAQNQLAVMRDQEGKEETYTYDEEGRLCRKRDRNGVETHYTYNLYGNLLSRQAGELVETYQYTPEGLLKAAIAGGMHYKYTYDAMGRLTSKQASGRNLLSLTYDLNGNLTHQEDVTGKVTKYHYNQLDQVSEVWDQGKPVASYTYYPDGRVKSLKNGDSLYTKYTYDGDKNLTRLKTMFKEEMLVDNHYGYDGNGNRTKKRQLYGGTHYTYDALKRLSRVEYPGFREELFYDQAGNRIRRLVEEATGEQIGTLTAEQAGVWRKEQAGAGGKVWEEIYYYDSRNRLTERVTKEAREHYTYDEAGNLLRDGRAAYTYDAFNRITKAETFSGEIQINRYDAEGLRYEIEENGRLVQFIFRDRQIVLEEGQEEKVRYIRTEKLLASDAECAKTWYHYASDELGSITHVEQQGEILNRYEYDAWGNLTICEEMVENRFKYTGEQLDPVSQQYYLRARYYNPVIGRFTQEDTYYEDGLNLYAYCKNNPINYVDPGGNICEAAARSIMNKLNNNQAGRNEERRLAAYLRNKAKREGGLSEEEARAAERLGVNIAGENGSNIRILYRGDRASVKPEIVFENGFIPKGTHNDALLHTKSNTTAGNFISTTSDKTIAKKFAGKNGYVYVIETGNYVDINKTYGTNAYYPHQMEFSVPGGVKPSEIVGAYTKRSGIIVGDFIPNPNFGGNQ